MKPEWFSVHNSCKIRGSAFRPGVCYHVVESMRPTIEGLSLSGMATFYDEEVKIISGRAYPAKGTPKQGQDEKAVSASSPSSSRAGKLPGPAPVWKQGKGR